jgi:dienelactone hydrolase
MLNTRLLTFGALTLLCLTTVAYSADDSDPSRRAVTDYCVREAAQITEQGRRDTASIGAWERICEKRRAELQEMLGLAPWPRRTPLKAVITGKLVKRDYVIEKLVYQSLPLIYVTANLYVPSSGDAPHPAVVYLCGHLYSPYGAKAAYQKYPASLARYGYVVLAIDPIQISETYAIHHGPSGYGLFDWYALGYTAGGAEVWNAIRGIDYLETRPEVDVNRIGMTGRSGGGAMSWLTAALDPRVKVIVPGASIITYASHLRDYTTLQKCDCMFFGNIYRHDMLDLGGLLAPRPVYMIYGKKDPGFPSAYPEFERQIGALYRAYGKPDALRSLGEDAGHEGTELQRSEMIHFLDRYLMGIPVRPIDLAVEETDPRDLVVFSSGAPTDARNYLLPELLSPPATLKAPATREAWETRKQALLADLREHVLVDVGDVLRRAPSQRLAASGSEQGWSEGSLEGDSGIPIRLQVDRPQDLKPGRPALLYVASEGETTSSISRALLGARASHTAVAVIVYPRGVSATPWDETYRRQAMRNAIVIGQTVDSMRLRDVIEATHAVLNDPQVDPSRVVVCGKGVSAGLALYAAILVPEVAEVVLIDPPESHRQGPYFLNVLRYTDLPEAAALLAPRRVNFFGRIPAAYSLTQQLFALSGQPSHVFLTMSLEGVLNGRYDHGFASGW